MYRTFSCNFSFLNGQGDFTRQRTALKNVAGARMEGEHILEVWRGGCRFRFAFGWRSVSAPEVNGAEDRVLLLHPPQAMKLPGKLP